MHFLNNENYEDYKKKRFGTTGIEVNQEYELKHLLIMNHEKNHHKENLSESNSLIYMQIQLYTIYQRQSQIVTLIC